MHIYVRSRELGRQRQAPGTQSRPPTQVGDPRAHTLTSPLQGAHEQETGMVKGRQDPNSSTQIWERGAKCCVNVCTFFLPFPITS